ncbi:MAG: transmembrane sensor [Alteromonadaceae bacterium]|jgi:transmembrane sensor
MSKISQFNTKVQIQEQASLWISRMDRGLAQQERQDLIAWINQNRKHHECLLSLASLWDDLSVLNELSGIFPLEKVHKKQSIMPYLAMAASMLLVVVTSSSLLLGFNPASLFHQTTLSSVKYYQTKIGEQATFSMPDGTSMQLNTNSKIEVAYTAKHRKLTLLQGEARFDVAKDKDRPFTVVSGTQSFTALGTIFNVQKNNEHNMELVVTEGKVLISKSSELIKDVADNFEQLTRLPLMSAIVTSGQKALIENSQAMPIQKISLDQVQRDLAWQQGMLIFNGEPLAKALKEVSRYTNTHFEISDERIANLKVAGYFKAGDIDGLLQSLHVNFNIDYQKTSANMIKLALPKT